jgi:hypothetical protein
VPIRILLVGHAVRCDEIIATLPYFFGIDAGVDELINPEISWMAVHSDHRHRGVGKPSSPRRSIS